MKASSRSISPAARPPAARRADQPDADQHHRHRQHLPHRGPARQEAEEGVGLAEELADDAGDAVAHQERAGQPAEPHRARARRARQRVEHDEQHQAFQQRLVDLARDGAAPGRRVGKIIAQGSQSGAGRPQSSPLMKLAMRPSPSPIGTQTASRSAKPSSGMRLRAAEDQQRDDDAEHAAMEAHAARATLRGCADGCARYWPGW